uniref:Uncharacterized protein n=1 Tax=Arundo donax TaxID=35708 RepID=A0A0A9G0V0_ARUDO
MKFLPILFVAISVSRCVSGSTIFYFFS